MNRYHRQKRPDSSCALPAAACVGRTSRPATDRKPKMCAGAAEFMIFDGHWRSSRCAAIAGGTRYGASRFAKGALTVAGCGLSSRFTTAVFGFKSLPVRVSRWEAVRLPQRAPHGPRRFSLHFRLSFGRMPSSAVSSASTKITPSSISSRFFSVELVGWLS
jgi:hypothetical protein